MPTGSELFVASLKNLGVTHLFTLVGDHLNDVLRVADEQGLRIIDTRHESAAAHMADGWARMTRRPGVSLVTGGPGHTNSISGIAAAQATGSPLAAVSGMSHSGRRDRFAFQDMDQLAQVQGITKYAAVPASAGQIPFHVHRAFLEAMNGRRGAVHLSIPVDLFSQGTESHAPLPEGPVEPLRPAADPAGVEAWLDLLERAERPVVVAGSGVWWPDAGADLQRFIEKTGLPLFTICLARGVVSDEHPLCFGYADPTLNRAARACLKKADLVVVLGKKLDFRMRLGGPELFSPQARFVQVDIHPQELGLNRRLDVGLAADVREALKRGLEGRSLPDWSAWREEIASERKSWRDELEAAAREDSSEPMHPLRFFAGMRGWVPEDAVLSWDGGDFVHWGRCSIPARRPGAWQRLGGLAGLGVSFPISLAAKVLHPERPSILVTGDGSLGFYLAEMDTAVRHGLPVILIVGNDGGWGIERELQRGTFGGDRTVACELRRTRYDLVMQGFGGEGETVEQPAQIRPALDRALQSGKPYLINVQVRGAASPFTQYQLSRKKG